MSIAQCYVRFAAADRPRAVSAFELTFHHLRAEVFEEWRFLIA
jgi:hypothetical protein